MKKGVIILKWKEKGTNYQKEIDKEEMLKLMDAIKNLFYNDNEISSILVNVIPKLVSIEIDKDRNEEREEPMICCVCEDGIEKVIEIKRKYHSIIWGIFDKICTE